MKIVVLNEGSSDSRVSASLETVKKISEMNSWLEENDLLK